MAEDKALREEGTQEETAEETVDFNATESEETVEQEAVNEEQVEDTTEPSLEQQLESLQEELDASQEKYLRLYAEFENYKRRIQNEADIQKTYRAQSVLTDVLPTLDNIERALQIEGDDESFIALKKGVQMVYDSLIKALEDNGLERIKAEGEQFDPNYHQAVIQDDNPEFESGAVTEELQSGYKLKDRVLRASMVKVNQ
ncbi:nucleotide exchange factor GrpE [Staphylococcus muscae]|uniref:Protein GrpE n=1 Tax=Staphylococcus muscae TaxID=1294 RepID=A0A240C555_9STAP|nr:nucleotide exchange factor GrpE [Staphylococcus muscae]AVQ33048.1 nucleotide exchange factor GrpE [Staphylococcus muscae]PNZ05589.1 nucleotide exchange factor GrpE [Staphylococcus muscae]GGA88788.1 protein GrpE [Staphylococcus muscae]SNW02423.1 co-chaperone GrpE [Staphylococcus muscae]